MTEMRKDRRAPASLKVKYKSATVDEFIEHFGSDVSRGGIFIKTKKPLDAGALLKFEFQLHDGSPVIHGVGRVAWKRGEASARPDLPAGMGIKFVKLDDPVRNLVDRIAASHGARPSRFDLTDGAEHAPPLSSAPPPSRAAMPSAMRNSAPPPAISSLPPPSSSLAPVPPAARVSLPSAPARASLPSAPTRGSMPSAPTRSVAPLRSSVSPAIANLFDEATQPVAAPARPSPMPAAAASAFKLPKGMAGSFFSEEKAAPQVTTNARDTSEFLASAFSVGGAGKEVRAEAQAQAERARREQEPSELADELFGDIADRAPAVDSLMPLGDPEELAGLGRVSEPKIPSLEEVTRSEEIPSFDELSNEAAADGLPFADDAPYSPPVASRAPAADGAMFGEASLSEAPPAQLRLAPPSSAPPKAKRSNAGAYIALVVVLIAVAAGGYVMMNRGAGATPPPSAATPEPAAQAAAPAAPAAEAQPTAAEPTPAAAAAEANPQPVAEAQAGPAVDVNVTSLPPGASIAVDGKPSGITPTTLSLPSVKPVELTVSSAGYATLSKTIEPSAGMEPVRFKLEVMSYVVVVTTDPPGATLSVRDLKVVSPAPLDLGRLEGMVTVAIEMDGYQRSSRIVRLEEFSERDGAMRADIALSLSALPTAEKKPVSSSSRSGRRNAPPKPAAAPVPDGTPVVQVKPAAPPEPEEPKPAPKPAALPDNPF